MGVGSWKLSGLGVGAGLTRVNVASFDASLALEMVGFTGPEAKEGLASLREKRKPEFPPPPSDF